MEKQARFWLEYDNEFQWAIVELYIFIEIILSKSEFQNFWQ